MPLDKKHVVAILENAAHRDLIEYLLGRVNLNDEERGLLTERFQHGKTQEQIAEEWHFEPRTIQRKEAKAFDKIIRNWDGLQSDLAMLLSH